MKAWHTEVLNGGEQYLDTIQQLKLWKWRITLNGKMLSLPGTHRVYLCNLGHGFGIYTFRSPRPCLIIEVLENWAKFLELSGYCSVINYAFSFHKTNDFGCLGGVMAQF